MKVMNCIVSRTPYRDIWVSGNSSRCPTIATCVEDILIRTLWRDEFTHMVYVISDGEWYPSVRRVIFDFLSSEDAL